MANLELINDNLQTACASPFGGLLVVTYLDQNVPKSSIVHSKQDA